eukprot:g4993.t1
MDTQASPADAVLSRRQQLEQFKKAKAAKTKKAAPGRKRALRSSNTHNQQKQKKPQPATRKAATTATRTAQLAAPKPRKDFVSQAELLRNFHASTPQRFRTLPKGAAPPKGVTPGSAAAAAAAATAPALSHAKAQGAAAAAAASVDAPGTPLGKLKQRLAAAQAASGRKAALPSRLGQQRSPPAPPAAVALPKDPAAAAVAAAALAAATVAPSTPMAKVATRPTKQRPRAAKPAVAGKAAAAKAKAKPSATASRAAKSRAARPTRASARASSRSCVAAKRTAAPATAAARARTRASKKAAPAGEGKRMRRGDGVRRRNMALALNSRIDEAMLLAKLGRVDGARKIMDDITSSPEFPAAKKHAVYWVARAKLEEEFAQDCEAASSTYEQAVRSVTEGVERDIVEASRADFDERERRRSVASVASQQADRTRVAPAQPEMATNLTAAAHGEGASGSPNRRLSFSTSESASAAAPQPANPPTASIASRGRVKGQGGVFSDVCVAVLRKTYESQGAAAEDTTDSEAPSSDAQPARPSREPPAVPTGHVAAAMQRMSQSMPFTSKGAPIQGVALPGMVRAAPAPEKAPEGDADRGGADSVEPSAEPEAVDEDAFAQYLGCASDDSGLALGNTARPLTPRSRIPRARAPEASPAPSAASGDETDDILATAAACARLICPPTPQIEGSHVAFSEVRSTKKQQQQFGVGGKVLTPCRKSSRLAAKQQDDAVSHRKQLESVGFAYVPNGHLDDDFSAGPQGAVVKQEFDSDELARALEHAATK